MGGQVGTSTPAGSALNVEQNNGWRTVSRPVRDKGKRPVYQANSYMALIFIEEADEEAEDSEGEDEGVGVSAVPHNHT